MTQRAKTGIVLGFLACFLSFMAKGQYTQQLRGTVVDLVLQKPLAGATVSINAINRSVITDENGVFRFNDLPVGTYQLSRLAGYPIFDEKDAYSQQNPAYFRTDLRVSMKWNRKKLTSTLSLDIQNVTNRENIFTQYYDIATERLVNSYQTGIIPVLNYKIEF